MKASIQPTAKNALKRLWYIPLSGFDVEVEQINKDECRVVSEPFCNMQNVEPIIRVEDLEFWNDEKK